ncbi:hypothetical protein KR51_00036940 [Rubidibacter lacunae KORDI 51-2]|uniref:Uncharacterized protein n=1 Tax=Rubidibacter lacunae KORDI 51-2 TaxID=582515 RepID=U5DJH2_9CHRO|nr:hypothetical protein KR51_00036940 [Rubidibacter lacunae KORDI 51-2]
MLPSNVQNEREFTTHQLNFWAVTELVQMSESLLNRY